MEFLPRTLLFYMLMHVYLFLRLYLIMGRRKVFWITAPWFCVMGLFPYVFGILWGKPGGQLFANLGIAWLPFAVFLMAVLIVTDTLVLTGMVVRRLVRYRWIIPNKKWYLAFLFLVAASFHGYGVYEAKNVRTVHLTLPSPHLPDTINTLRLAFVSDLHIGPQTGISLLSRTIDRILEEKPDVILLGGDILDDAFQGTDGDMAQLRRLSAPYGVFGVLGNHESYGGYEAAMKTLLQANITIIENSVVQAGPLAIAGLEDPYIAEQKGQARPALEDMLATAGEGVLKVVLEHRPLVREQCIGLFDLQLSGHTHGGQFIVFQPMLQSIYGIPTGFSSLSNGEATSHFYVTRGIGYSKIPVRFFVPPEVVVIDLVHEGDVEAMTAERAREEERQQ